MLRMTLIAATMLVISGVSFAAEPKERGFYIGAGYGMAVLDDDGLAAGLDFDDSDKTLFGFAGYKFFKYFAVEGRVNDLGTYTIFGESLDISSVSAHAIGVIPFGQSGWEVFGQLGVGRLKIEGSNVDPDSWTTSSAGLGVRWSITDSFSLAVQTDVYLWQEEDFSDTYDLFVGTNSLAVRFLF